MLECLSAAADDDDVTVGSSKMKSMAPSEIASVQTLAFASYLRPYNMEDAYVRVAPSGLVIVRVHRLPGRTRWGVLRLKPSPRGDEHTVSKSVLLKVELEWIGGPKCLLARLVDPRHRLGESGLYVLRCDRLTWGRTARRTSNRVKVDKIVEVVGDGNRAMLDEPLRNLSECREVEIYVHNLRNRGLKGGSKCHSIHPKREHLVRETGKRSFCTVPLSQHARPARDTSLSPQARGSYEVSQH